ncbi:MAG: AraC family transcriptional regulator [Bacteroidota bacterium]
MKAALEKIHPVFGSSFTIRKFTDENTCRAPFWHFHPEFEIVYISAGSGKRHIGNHLSYYEQGDLIFLGPNLPHLSFTDELYEKHTEVVIQLKGDFLGQDFLQRPEMQAISDLFERARLGLSFDDAFRQKIGQRLIDMVEMDHFSRLIELLQVLQEMATTDAYTILNASGFGLEISAQGEQRINAIYTYVDQHFRDNIPLEAIAQEVNMTVPAFCRFFKKLTQKTFTTFVNEFRVAYACKQLSEDQLSIAEVCLDSGFNNVSHFNKQFKAITGKSPSVYRKEVRQVIDQASSTE